MKNGIRIVLLILIISVTTGAICVAQDAVEKQSAIASESLSKGIACLASQDWVKDDLRDLGLHERRIVRVRFQAGSIPGVSPETPDNTNVLFLSSNGQQGWLLFFRQE